MASQPRWIPDCRSFLSLSIVSYSIYQFEAGLPSAWQTHRTIRLAQNLEFEKALSFYKTVAREDRTLPGAINASNKPGPDRAHTTKEVCRLFIRGKCFRKNCKFLHPGERKAPNNNKPTCKFCKNIGHTIDECRKLKAKEKAKEADRNNEKKQNPEKKQNQGKRQETTTFSMEQSGFDHPDLEFANMEQCAVSSE